MMWGITPACAGKSVQLLLVLLLCQDHPRVCGEKWFRKCRSPGHKGSPPRMRGKAVQMGIRLVQPGITLAYAGKSDFRGTGSYRRRDHPRVCGEKHAVPVSAIWSAGSPPRVRGKASCILVSSSTVGITPAYAGKSVCNIPCANWQGDHPRVCGEKLILIFFVFFAVGSPPRVRGKEEGHPRSQGSQGITPAYAGKRFRLGLHTS